MAETGRVGICLDEAMGHPLAEILLRLRAPAAPDIHDVQGLGLRETTDEVLLAELGRRHFAALVTRDSSMLAASIRRDAWRRSGLCLFVCDGKWGNLRLFEIGRRLLWWWPLIVEQARAGPQGGAWSLSTDLVPGGLRQMFAEGGPSA
jgi:hypothetical protein